MPFNFRQLNISGVVAITPQVFRDGRGAFAELYKQSAFVQAGIHESFVQFNRSRSQQNVLRGLHYQMSPGAQGKMVQVTAGKIFDVAVDIRRESETYKKWVSVELDATAGQMLYVPPGMAHGFYVISQEADVTYYCTAEYEPELERGIIWNDQEIAIDWPSKEPLLSARDKAFKSLRNTEH